MNNLVRVKGNYIFTDSLIIARGTNNQHESVIRILDTYKKKFAQMGVLRFSDLKSGNPSGGRPTKVCELNEMQATFLITLLKNTDKVVDFKFNLVQEFYRMRHILVERLSPEWQAIRKQSKEVRRIETDAIKDFVEYARASGSKNAERYYGNLTKLVHKAARVQSRDTATGEQLNTIAFLEKVITRIIRQAMKQSMEYKDIYKSCKSRVEAIRGLSLLDMVA